MYLTNISFLPLIIEELFWHRKGIDTTNIHTNYKEKIEENKKMI